MKPQFISSINTFITRGLFYEESPDKSLCVFTLKDDDIEVPGVGTMKSLKKIYMSYDDPTEYMFVLENLYNWAHWTAIKESPWFQKHYKEWRTEFEVRERSKALARIMETASSTDRNAFAANRYLLEKDYVKPKTKDSVGRPTKESIRKQAEDLFNKQTDMKEDWERINGKNNLN